MTYRITSEDLDIQLGRYVRACERHGLIADGDRIGLDHGSKTYGRAFRVYTIPNGSTAHYNPPHGHDYLGMTKADAFHSLALLSAALECVPARVVIR